MRRTVVLACVSACGFAPTVTGGGSNATDAAIDGSAPDAPPDAPPVWKVVDSFTVPCLGTTVVSTVTLTSTGTYHLRASGECIVSNSGSLSDAEYFGYNLGVIADAQSGVDNGIAIDNTTPGATKPPHWGDYNATDHTYEVPWTGANATITAMYWDSNYPNNGKELTLEILEFK